MTQLEVGPQQSPDLGTGFFVGYTSPGGDRTADFLVSNRHVVRAGNEGRFTLHRSFSDASRGYLGPDLDRVIHIPVTNWQNAWIDHPDPEVDVSVMNVTSANLGLTHDRNPAFYTKIAVDMFADRTLLSAFDSMEEVLFVGYPEGISDRVHHLPILRRGVTASPMSIDYERRPAFLLDGSVYAGASGCPVVIPRPGVTPVGGLPFGGQPILVGILAKTFERIDFARASEVDIPMRVSELMRVKTYLNTGLAFRAQAVREAIEHHVASVPIEEVREDPGG